MSETSLKKNISYTTVGMVMYNFAIWVFSILILRMLGPQASGYYAVATSIGNSLYAISLWGMRSYVISDTNNEYSYQEYLTARFSAIGITLLILLGIVIFVPYSSTQREILVLYSLFKCCEALIEILDCFCQKKKRMEINAYSMILRSILFTVFFYLSLRFFHDINIAFILLIILSLLVFVLFNFRRVKRLVPIELKPTYSKSIGSILYHSLPIMAFEMLSALIVAVPRLQFEKIGDLGTLGIYTSIYTMIVFLQLVINVLIYTLAPYMASAYANKDSKQFLKYVGFLFMGAFGLGLVAEGMVFLLGKPVMTLLFGEIAGNQYHYLYLGIVSGVTLTFTWIMSQIFVIYQKRLEQCLCAIISLVGCYVLSKYMVSASSCDSISLVTTYANLLFLGCSCIFLFVPSHK